MNLATGSWSGLFALMLTLTACSHGSAPTEPTIASADVVVAWNQRVLAIAQDEDKFLTLKGVRTAAMMHLAMHDALNAIDPRYQPYAFDVAAPNADPIVAVAQAAYEIAVNQYPAQKAVLEDELSRWRGDDATPASQHESIALGKAAAAAILLNREGDGWDTEAVYRWHPMGPGVYAEFHEHSGTPQGFVFGIGWAAARPFMLRVANQFRSPPPPPIESEAYAKAFEEVRELGRYQSTTRTADQAHLAMWWKDFAENSHNRLARQLVNNDHTGLWPASRLFALLNMSIFDGYIGVFENKFHYNHWRPYTAIRWADHDGNSLTQSEADWDNLHRHTYAFPSYPSAHGTVCAAAMTTFADTFGDEYEFTMRTVEVDSAGPMSPKLAMDPPTRSFNRFSEAAMECALSRIYLGIHFRYDSTAGYRLGQQIGGYALATILLPRQAAGGSPNPETKRSFGTPMKH